MIAKLCILTEDSTVNPSDILVDNTLLKVALLKRMDEIHLSPDQVIGLTDPLHLSSVLKTYSQTVE